MKQRMILETTAKGTMREGQGPDGAGFITLCMPASARPLAHFAYPVAWIPTEMLEALLIRGARCYGEVDLDAQTDDPDLVDRVGFFKDAQPQVSISHLEIV